MKAHENEGIEPNAVDDFFVRQKEAHPYPIKESIHGQWWWH